jgi:hypothetical protein
MGITTEQNYVPDTTIGDWCEMAVGAAGVADQPELFTHEQAAYLAHQADLAVGEAIRLAEQCQGVHERTFLAGIAELARAAAAAAWKIADPPAGTPRLTVQAADDPEVVVVIDTSGSLTATDLDSMVAEVVQVEQGLGFEITEIECDQ